MVKKYSTYLNESLKDKDRFTIYSVFTINSVQSKFKEDENRHDYKPGCNYIKNLLYGKHVLIEILYRKNNGGREENVKLYVMDVIRPFRPVSHNYTFIDCEGNEYEPHYLSNIYYYDDKKGYEKCKEIYDLKVKEKEKRKEEIRLKYKDVDPYGEEDWENESKVNESNLTLSDFKVGDRIIYTWRGHSTDEDIGPGLRNDLHGLTGTVIKNYHNNRYLGIQFNKKLDFLHDCGGLGEKLKCYYVIPSAVEHLDQEERKRRKEEIRLKYADVDPYEEEDWEN